MRRLGKRIVAITLAATMMGSLTPQAMTFLQNEVVYAAETSGVVYESNESKAQEIDFSKLSEEKWEDNNGRYTLKYAFTNNDDIKVNPKYTLKAKATIDKNTYDSLGEDGYIKVQPITKVVNWDGYTKPSAVTELKKSSFKEDGDVYVADIQATYQVDKISKLMEIDFEVVGVKAKGSISFSDVSVTNEASASAIIRTELYKSETSKTKENIDFTNLEKEDWDGNGKIIFPYDEGIKGSVGNVNEEYELTAKVTIDEASYQTLSTDKAHLNIQGVTKLGEQWDWKNSTDCQWLQKDSFQKDGDNYSADLKVKFSGITPAALMDVEFVIVGTGFKGNVTFSNVVLTNLSSDKQELVEQDPTILSDLNDEAQANQWEGETGYQYSHGGNEAAKPNIAYDANGEDGRLKVSLDYTANSKETWSEAKVKFTPKTAADISNYNQLSVDLIYPENSNISKMKFFSDGTINKDCNIDTSEAVDAGNGYKKVTVTMGFSPSTTPLKDVTIGIIGVNSSFKGDVYLDNLTLSQKDASADYTKITETPNADGTQANVEVTDKTLTMTDSQATDSAKALYAYLQGLTESDQVLFGHQNDVSRSVSGKELGDVKDVTGSVSGIFGIDSLSLFGSEAGGTDAKTALDNSIKYSKDAAEKGAIVTLSAHMPNFTNAKITKNEDGTYNFFNCDFNESKDTSGDSLKKILPGGEKNEVYKAYLDTIAKYANELQKANIPVIFRPFHENTGSWFWWGSANTAESYKSLYAYTRDYLESQGVHNMLYVYSPNGPLESEEDYMKAYPGDAYVDILAFDYYNDFNTYPASADTSFFDNLDKTCSVVSSVAKKHDKLAAISETGTRVMKKDGSDNEGLLVKNNPVSEAKSGKNWYQEVSNIAKKNDMPYYLVWANFSDTNFYVPYKYNDTLGQEMINDFISYYNDDSSIFGNGTNFYNNVSALAKVKTENYKEISGYMVAPFDMDAILGKTILKASVSNASEVSFVVKDTATNKSKTLVATKDEESGLYTAELTDAIMAEIGQTDVAQIQLVADGKTLSTIENLSLGKEKEKAPAGVLENFDYYVGSNGLLDVAYNGNSAAGCSSSFTLDKTYKSDGTYGAAFNYKLKTASSEVWTGLVNSKLSNTDFSAYNALKFWTKLDGKGQKVVVQIKAGGEEFEVYLTNLAKTTGEYELTVPFSAFKGKNEGTLDVEALKDVQAFGIWCNSNPAGEAVDVESTIYFDAFVGTNASESEMTKVDVNGFVIADTNSGNNGGSTGGSTGGTTTPGTTTPDKPSSDTKTETSTETKPDGTKIETTTTTKEDGSVTKKSEITDASGKKTATVTVKTDATGKTTATASVTATAKSGAKTTISADTVKKITDAAGTDEVVISQRVADATGKVLYTVKANASDLTAGNKLSIVKYNTKTKKYVLVSKKEYKVSASGNVSVTIKNNGTYKLVSQKKADEITKSVLKTVKAKNTAKTLKKGKKTTMALSSALDKSNVSKITYSSSKSSVAKVDKNGKVTAKKAGTATIKAKVTLKNGKTKTVTMKVTVK